ncbi:DNA-binding response regulator, LuxR family protein [Alteromonas macleodii str. 'Black Sea 11']|jgi:two-component system response regulator DesR|uniref:response regulator transcription factor n=1 Tax=Alteromonas abrolhosensis TaxID=1892904 RepID=UPI000286F198|nr:DNA-binding response regulator, LuxR family protein [Alteromonas macleodii str. 'Black Sea 11']NKX05907.1 response regulator transcription factor [Alteromonadaceae bacterium A_SAG6]NKX17834.1 response regulator transcription factor [Alteromonadaceae bacterium A_SAG5]NKX34553.1 response regulator transcription factor [Alteromonadaceae bacterium A_SAG3]
MNLEPTTSILIVEDQSLVRDAIAMLLSLEDDLTIVAKCSNGQEAINYLNDNPTPHIILSDIEMPLVSGLDLAAYVTKQSLSSKVVLMTTFSKPGYIKRALSIGVKGFILKESDSDYLIDAIHKVSAGDKVISPELAIMALDDNNPLSQKEMSALKLASDGLKTQAIAQQLFLSEGTVRNYLSEAISKLDATNRVDAARIAKQKGWL